MAHDSQTSAGRSTSHGGFVKVEQSFMSSKSWWGLEMSPCGADGAGPGTAPGESLTSAGLWSDARAEVEVLPGCCYHRKEFVQEPCGRRQCAEGERQS